MGGILDNKNKPADYFFDNIQIISNTFELAKIHKVKKLLMLVQDVISSIKGALERARYIQWCSSKREYSL